MPSTPSTARICPACNAPVSPSARSCPICKLEVARMDAFAAAKQAAANRGMKTTKIETDRPPFYSHLLRPVVILPVILAALLIYYLTRPAPPPAWTQFPRTPVDAARAILTDIAKDNNKFNEHAYSLIAPSVHDPQNENEKGQYFQIFTTMCHYLDQECGGGWINAVTFEADKADPTAISAHIGIETLHIHTALQTPADKLNDTNAHYAVIDIAEFSIADAAGFSSAGIATGLLRSYGATGSIRDLESIKAAFGGHLRETPMQTKLRVLPVLRDPRSAKPYTVLQAWRARTDPVIRHHLDQITHDGRYDLEVQAIAQQILDGTVPEEVRVGAGLD